MITALQGSVYRDGTPVTDRDVAHMMIAILMAGQHTSSATSSWTLLHLADRPDIVSVLLWLFGRNLANRRIGIASNYMTSRRKCSAEKMGHLARSQMRALSRCLCWTLLFEKRFAWSVSILHSPGRAHVGSSTLQSSERPLLPSRASLIRLSSIYRKVISPIPVPPSLSSPSGSDSPYVIPQGHFLVAAPGVSAMDPLIWSESKTWNPMRWLDEKGIAPFAKEQYSGSTSEQIDYGFGQMSKGTESPYQPFGAGRHR